MHGESKQPKYRKHINTDDVINNQQVWSFCPPAFVKMVEEPVLEMGLRAFPLMRLLSFMRHHLKYPAHPHEEASSDS